MENIKTENEKLPDLEWLSLILQARRNGLTIEEIRNFIASVQKKRDTLIM